MSGIWTHVSNKSTAWKNKSTATRKLIHFCSQRKCNPLKWHLFACSLYFVLLPYSWEKKWFCTFFVPREIIYESYWELFSSGENLRSFKTWKMKYTFLRFDFKLLNLAFISVLDTRNCRYCMLGKVCIKHSIKPN